MRYKVKDIGEAGLDVAVPVSAEWMAAEIPDLEARPGAEGLALTGRIEKSGGDSFLLRGDLRGTIVTSCARCLEEARLEVDVPVAVSYVEAEEDEEEDPFADGGEEDDGDQLTFSGGEIDLGGEIRDEILLAIPIGPICREDCAGICPVCGGNRNAVPCGCEERQRQAASKFGALKDFKV